MKYKFLISLIVSFFLAISFDFVSAFVPPATFEKDIDFSVDYSPSNNKGRFELFKPAYEPDIIYSHGTWTYSEWSSSHIHYMSYQYDEFRDVNLNEPFITSPPFSSYMADYPTGYYWLGWIRVNALATAWTTENSTFWPIYWDGSILSYSVNGTCGSANGGSFANTPNSDLCSSGTLGSMGVTDDGTTYRWSCMGSNGGGYENCSANVSLATAQCGYSNGTVALTEPYSSHACLNGSITDMTENDSGSWSWKCRIDSTDFVFCNTVASAPVIPETLPSNDSISCSISPTDLSTIGDCIGSIFRWAFLPHQDTLNSFYSIPQTLASKIPFGYFYSISDELKSVSLNPPANVVFSMKSFDSSDVVLLDVNSFKSWAGPDIVNFYFGVLRALLWFGFLIWVFNKGRNIFSSNDNEK